jgi:hypothetical protein
LGLPGAYAASHGWSAGTPETESMAKFPGEMRIVVKAAGVGDLPKGLAGVPQRPSMQKAGGMIQTNRIAEMATNLLNG